MEKTTNWRSTIFACYRGNFTHAAVNNLSPLFFIIYQDKFGLSYTLLATLILFNFCTQILADLLSVKFVDKIGYRKAALFSQFMAALGLLLLAVLPNILPLPFVGLAVASTVAALGGGVMEVILSPIVDAIPGEAKASAMSLLHSFYCWGQVFVVLATTVILRLIGTDLWFLIPVLWATIPIYNFFSFLKVPLQDTISPEEKTPLRTLFTSKIFIVAMVIMVCAGASELSMCQWSSLFAEKALGVPKVLGDLLGPCLFAVFMGIGRVIFGIYGEKINLFKTLIASAVLCVFCYLGTALFALPVLSLVSCALCGLSVSLMWPGTISCSAAMFPKGGASMFGILAVMGDIGCSVGPALLGAISDGVKDTLLIPGLSPDQIGLKTGMLSGMIFPFILLLCVIILMKYAKKHKVDIQKPAA
ncbi:MAG: MFS transporter [Oscillospiraceae bacterium]